MRACAATSVLSSLVLLALNELIYYKIWRPYKCSAENKPSECRKLYSTLRTREPVTRMYAFKE